MAGLYLVLWGKSKDYKSPPPLIERQIEPANIDMANNEKDSFDNQAITIDATETSIRNEKIQEKSDSIPV